MYKSAFTIQWVSCTLWEHAVNGDEVNCGASTLCECSVILASTIKDSPAARHQVLANIPYTVISSYFEKSGVHNII